MFDRFKGNSRTTIVGIPSFDDAALNLLKAAESLALRTGMSLRLVHVIENALFPYGLYPDTYVSSDLPFPRQDELEQTALTKLKELQSNINPQVKSDIGAVFGGAASMLIAEAQIRRASLILCGVRPNDHQYIPRAFSTVLTLMSESPVPILAVPINRAYDFNKSPLTLLAGDDLNDDSRAALGLAAELAINLGNVRFVHLHVHKQTRAEMEKVATQVMEGLTKYQLERDAKYGPTSIFETILGNVKSTMDIRLGTLKSAVAGQKGTSYEQLVVFGEPIMQLAEAVDRINPDIVVFGRHRWIHKRPFTLGKMPAHAMLNLRRPMFSVCYAG